VAASVVLGIAVSARVGPLAADRVGRDVAEAVQAAPAEVVIHAGRPGPGGVRLELWCADQLWCKETADRLGGELGPGFVRLHLSRAPLSSA